MKTSPDGRKAITLREGKKNRAYRDSKGLWTIGVGHYTQPPNFTRFSKWTDAQVDAALEYDLGRFEKCVNDTIHVAMTQNEFDAMVSLAFNIGEHGFVGSTVAHFMNLGLKAQAANAFLKWVKPAILLSRRLSEKAQFLRE